MHLQSGDTEKLLSFIMSLVTLGSSERENPELLQDGSLAEFRWKYILRCPDKAWNKNSASFSYLTDNEAGIHVYCKGKTMV